MENYKIVQQLGQGAQATIFLAEKKDTGKSYVLKKVECFDESEANKAFRESQDLLSLEHPYVSGYNEFFIMWEKENSSVFMTIVMDYFPHGNLGTIMQKHRESKDVIPEEKIKNWVGQVIEGLIYVHQKGIIHRDLRPNNLYLQEEGSLKLGDFSVATVMGDTRTCTRATLSSANYLAPELEDTGFTPVTDIWSLGCILFELTTSTFYDEKQVIEKMKEAKEDAFVLEQVFEDVANHYSGELISLIRLMLKRKDRPSASDLKKNNKYVKVCVEMTDASQLEKRKRQKSARKENRIVPKEGGLIKVLEHLATNIDFEEQVLESLSTILEMCKESETLQVDATGKRLISVAMRNNLPQENIQITGCSIFNRLLVTGSSDIFITRHDVKRRVYLPDKPGDAIFSSDVISIFPRVMEEHSSSAEVQQVAAASLMALACNSEAAEAIGFLGGVNHILDAMRRFPNNPELCATCCHALWSLSVIENNVKIVTSEKGLELVCNALKTHMNSPDVAEAACAALLSTTLNDENFEYVGDLDCVGLLISAIDTHTKNPKVVKNACMALASLVEPDEESAYRVLTNEATGGGHISGIPKVMSAYELHKDNAEVVESIATLLMELAEYDEICYDLVSFKIQDNVNEIRQKFARNEDIMAPCEKALSRLQATIQQKAQAAAQQKALKT
ncbi:serine/threonine kinase-like domain-containing protein STKLD1 isoform X2 [Mizuhopecten yessoensis]|uniref:serine/threonine kinase-like domain-containing protein STKLD1 isoform X2 n=1 Tax=Mizuhopecten yessoensis TaxID=6573 RepID=UPI000B45C464|nr:serine/threonine kinase-like domain-containing protein STKLD1 isoform X2 [Mizuhopecten yessoensis]